MGAQVQSHVEIIRDGRVGYVEKTLRNKQLNVLGSHYSTQGGNSWLYFSFPPLWLEGIAHIVGQTESSFASKMRIYLTVSIATPDPLSLHYQQARHGYKTALPRTSSPAAIFSFLWAVQAVLKDLEDTKSLVISHFQEANFVPLFLCYTVKQQNSVEKFLLMRLGF